MARGVSLRALLLGLTLCFGLLVLLLTMSGAADGLRDSGVMLDWTDRAALTRAILSTQFARGLIGLALALLLAGVVGTALGRMFRPGDDDAATDDARWLHEASDVADRFEHAQEEHAARISTLDRQRTDLDRLLEAVTEGILHLDGAGRVVRANRAARRLLSLPDDAAGRPLPAVVRSAELRELLRQAASDHTLPPREITFEERTLVVTARAMPPGADGDTTALAVAIADLTALRRMENVRRDFVANASHELKTPLTSIRGYAETLRDDDVPADTRRQFLDTIARNADRLQNIVDDLLDLSRLESGSWQPTLDQVVPSDIGRQAWADLAARARGVDFIVEDHLGTTIRADAGALRHILTNLLDNALRYSDEAGTIRLRITEAVPRALAPRDDRLRYAAIEVIDEGSGIPADALPRIFERFYRVDPARSRAEGGTGLGLAIVRHLVESMGGRVEAESLLGAGTTIRVLLPLADDGRPADSGADSVRRA